MAPRYIQPPEPCNRRYSQKERKEILAFVESVNAREGRGGATAAVKKFGVNYSSISYWLKQRGITSSLELGREERAKTLKQMREIEQKMDTLKRELADLKVRDDKLTRADRMRG